MEVVFDMKVLEEILLRQITIEFGPKIEKKKIGYTGKKVKNKHS
jgi:hypothetical protein